MSFFKYAVLGIFLLVFACSGHSTYAASDTSSTVVNLRVPGCNFNSICEPYLGEDQFVCPSDCVIATSTPPATSTIPTGVYYSSGTGIIVGTYTFDFFKIVSSTTSVTVSWTTSKPTITTLTWGSNSDGSQGTVTEASFRTVHEVVIYGLLPDTSYTLTMRALDVGLASVYHTYSFKTLPIVDHTLPPNISDFTANLSFGGNIILSWSNPTTKNFGEVYLTRGTRFYPRDPGEGYFVYEGKGEQTLDTHVSPGSTYYYSAFSKNNLGDFSSGAVTQFTIASLGTTNVPPPLYGGSVTTATSTIRFSQDGTVIPPVNGKVLIDREKQLMAFVPKESVPKDTEQSLINLTKDGVDRSYIFSNLEDGSLTTFIPAFLNGTYTYTVRFLGVGSEFHMNGIIETKPVLATDILVKKTPQNCWRDFLVVFFFLLFWLLIIILILWRKRRKDKQKE